MFVANWAPGLTPTLPELTAVPVWLEFREVPPHFFSEEGLEHIAGLVGHPVYLHPSTADMTNLEVAKVLTIIDPTKEIPEAVNAKFATGQISRIKVSCPWLPPICKHCSEMGHSKRHCPTAPVTCSGCQSTVHETTACPKKKKLYVKEGKEIIEVQVQGKERAKGKSSRKKRPPPEKLISNQAQVTDVLVIKERMPPPSVRDKSNGKGKAIECSRGSVSPKPRKGRKLVVDIGLDELIASSSKHKKDHHPNKNLPSKTSSSKIAVSSSDSDSLSDESYASESDDPHNSPSSDDPSSADENKQESESGFTPVLTKKQKKTLKKQSGSGKGPAYYRQ